MKLDRLNLKPDPSPEDREADLRRRESFLSLAELLLDDDRFAYASDTVTSMRDRVQAGDVPTERMFTALENIREGGRRHAIQERQWKRRYEGR
jgi:hypothetical protein